MPLFEYRCKKCGNVTTFLERIGEDKEHHCEKCESKETEKIFSKVSQITEKKSSCSTGTCPF